jgi:vacuolar-type H+-ATPase subunit I/STV1
MKSQEKSEPKRKQPLILAVVVVLLTALLTFGCLQVIHLFTADYKEQQELVEKQANYDQAIAQRDLALSGYQSTLNELHNNEIAASLLQGLKKEFVELELSDKNIQWIDKANTYNTLKIDYENYKEAFNDLPEAFAKTEAYLNPYKTMTEQLALCFDLIDANIEQKFEDLVAFAKLKDAITTADSASNTCTEILSKESERLKLVIQEADEIIVAMGGRAIYPTLEAENGDLNIEQ